MWEVNSGVSDEIPRDAVNQLLGQVQAETTKHPRATTGGVLLSDIEGVKADAEEAARDLTLMHTDAVVAVFDVMAEVFAAYRTAWGSGTASERGAARVAVEPRLPRADWLARLLVATNGKIQRAQVVRDLMSPP